MPAERFFLKTDFKGALFLQGQEHLHLSKVMRKKIGDEVELINGKGELARVKIVSMEKQQTEFSLIDLQSPQEFRSECSLAVPFMRPSKLELIVEKCTEIGVDHFLFYPAQFSEKKELSEKAKQRLDLIAIGAIKQSGRLYLPSIEIVSDFSSLFKNHQQIFFGDPRCKKAVHFSQKLPSLFISGPESGFSEKEQKMLEEKAIKTTLSPFTLRAETAPIVATSLLINQK